MFCGIKLHSSSLCVVVLAGEQGRVSATVTASETVTVSEPSASTSTSTVASSGPAAASTISQLQLYPLSMAEVD